MSASALLPTAPTTLVIVLGASAWPNSPGLQASKAFMHAAHGFRDYLLDPRGFGLPAANLLDLFDAPSSVSDQLEQLDSFLQQQSQALIATNQAARDVLVYFVGHGDFAGSSHDFYLMPRRANASSLRASGLSIDALADVLREKARQVRRYLLLDCCFAAAAFRSFLGGPDQTAIEKTLFSYALLDVLKNGDLHRQRQLSLRDIKELAEDRLAALPEKNAPRPGLHSPDQSEGDVADIPFFPNLRAVEEQARQAEEERVDNIVEQTSSLTPDTPKQEIKLFYCYAHEDKALRDELQVHLSGLRRQYQLTNWYDREILPGEEWEKAINKHLTTADVILLLISPDFVASDYCYGKEMQHALERHHAGSCCVIPILLRPTYWEKSPLSSIQMLPTDARPITIWPNRDEAFHDVARGIGSAIKAMLTIRSHKTKEEWLKEDHAFYVLNQFEEAEQARLAEEERRRNAEEEQVRKAREEQARQIEEAKRRQVEVERQRITPYDRKAVIITTMAVEYDAVRAHIQNLREIDNGRILGETGHFAGNDATWDVIIFQVSQGNISMAAETERIINSLQPDIALLIDIAAGTKEVRIGDVVVAEKVYGYESGKAWMSRLLTRPEVEKPSYSLLECARAEAGKLDWLRRLPKDLRGHFVTPRVLLAPIASGEKELSSTRSPLFRFLNAFYEDTLAIEMAGRGFLKAAPINSREVEALVICGIARLVDARRQEQEMHLLHDFALAQDGSTLAAQRASAFAFQVLAKLGPQATRERPKKSSELTIAGLQAARQAASSRFHPKKSSELTIAGLLVNENEGLTALDITLSNQGEQSIVVSGIQIDVLDVGVFSLCTNPISSGLRAVNIASAAYYLELFPALKGKSKTRHISHTLQPGEIELIRLYLNQNEDDPQQVYAWYYLKITLISSQQPLETPQPVLLSIPPVNRAMMEKVWFSGNPACDEPNRIILQRLATLPSIKSATVEDVIARF